MEWSVSYFKIQTAETYSRRGDRWGNSSSSRGKSSRRARARRGGEGDEASKEHNIIRNQTIYIKN
jgi:hypothetical protein